MMAQQSPFRIGHNDIVSRRSTLRPTQSRFSFSTIGEWDGNGNTNVQTVGPQRSSAPPPLPPPRVTSTIFAPPQKMFSYTNMGGETESSRPAL